MSAPLSTRDPHPLLEIRDATVRKGRAAGSVVLDHLRLCIDTGEHTVILGPNGSGKSSLIRLITQEYRPLAEGSDAQRVRVFGRDRWDVLELRRLLGIVTPETERMFVSDDIVGHLRALDVVVSGFFASPGVQPHQVVTAGMRERARQALGLMEADGLAEKRMDEMSTGEVRRVSIARALVSDPPALLLDEPTAGLDIVATARFLDLLRGLARSGRTLILVTHHIHEIVPEVKRVVLLRDGRVVADGKKAQVLTSEPLTLAFGAPVRVTVQSGGYYAASVGEAVSEGSQAGVSQ